MGTRNLKAVFEKMLPELKSVALSSRYNRASNASLIELLAGPLKLQHVSIELEDQDLHAMLEDMGGLSLKTLHLPRRILEDDFFRSRHRDTNVMASERIYSLKVERFYLYGRRSPQAEALEAYWFDDRDTVWIEDSENPPFENFDGR
ncbi:hypothetical protein JCM16303_004001 [Sporobolomyces ruberrimus]